MKLHSIPRVSELLVLVDDDVSVGIGGTKRHK